MRNVLFCVLVISANHQTWAQAITASAPRHALAISAPRPDYPLEARSHWLEGRGLFSLTIRPDGTVESVESGASSPAELGILRSRWSSRWPGCGRRALTPQAEKRGSQPPSGYASWRDYWQKCIPLWNGYHHSDHADYFRKRRKTLGLEEISAQ